MILEIKNILDISAIGIALLALVVSYFAFRDVKHIKNNAAAMTEWTINERITATKERISDIFTLMIDLTSKPISTRTALEKTKLESFNKQLDLAIENNLNAYEAACANYIDKKVDTTRFKQSYKSEIKKVVEDIHHKKYFDGVSSKFRAILKVYDEWENLEK